MIGDGVTVHTAVEIEIGPVDLETYWRSIAAAERGQRDALYRLVLPAHVQNRVVERWIVGNREEGAVLGDRQRHAALGVNSYLGTP